MNRSGTFERAARLAARALAGGALALLPACQIPGLRQAELPPVLPATFNGTPNGPNGATITDATAAENSATLRADEFYNDPVLNRLLCQAVAGNRELRILDEEVQAARAEVLARRGAYLPLIGFRSGAGWDRNSLFTPVGTAEKTLEYRPGRRFPATPGDFLLGFNFLIPLDIWRELRNTRDALIQRYQAAVERRNDALTRVVADVAEGYYGLMALDRRIQTLDQTIALQQQSLEIAKARFAAGRGTELAVQRFQAEVRKNESEKAIVRQDIVETENRINFLLGRLPQPVERDATAFFDVTITALRAGVPAQLLQNRPDIRQAERELLAAGLDIKVARARFFPRIDLTGNIGYQAFNPRYLFQPDALILNAAGELTAPVLNKAAIRAEYLAANARQLEAVYNYQRVVLSAVTEVVNRLSQVENYGKSIELRRQQLRALETSVTVAGQLFQAARIEYLEVLFAQRDLLEARTGLIDAKRQQLAAVVNAYQALGGGTSILCPPPEPVPVAAGPGAAPRMPDPVAPPGPRPEKPKEKEKAAPLVLPPLPDLGPPGAPKEAGSP